MATVTSGAGAARGGSSGRGRRRDFGGSLTTNDEQSRNGGGESVPSPTPPRPQAEVAAGGALRAESSNPPSKPKGKAKAKGKSNGNDKGARAGGTVAPATGATAQSPSDDNDDDDAALCFICAEPVKLYSLSPCNHRTCHICAIRLRALYKNKECTFCKAPSETLIFTSSPERDFLSFLPDEIPFVDKKLSVHFETQEDMEETIILLRFNCPDETCEYAASGWGDLKEHVKKVHSRLLCELCIKGKKIFAHEHTLHTSQSLQAHTRKEHGYCAYCRQNFYSDDELFVHMRDAHEQCHICRASGREEERWKYFRDYDMLEKHFRQTHYLCEVQECLDRKFVVFESEMDFKAHQVSEHGNMLSSKERRDALRVEANFHYSEPGAGGGGGSRRNRDRGGNNATAGDAADAEAPARSNPSGRREVPGAAPSRRGGFRGELTANSAPSGGDASSSSVGLQRQIASASLGGTGTNEDLIERHQMYLSRVLHILKDSESKLASFRANVRTFRNGEMSARDLAHSVYSLVEESVEDAGIVVRGLVDLLENEEKKKVLLAAWNALRMEIRTIKTKSASNTHVWANVEHAAASSATSGHGAGKPVALKEHFPSLGGGASAGGSRHAAVPGSSAHAASTTASLRHAAAVAAAANPSATRTTVVPTSSKPSAYSVHAKSGAGGASTSLGQRGGGVLASRAAFPSLPTNAHAASLAAHKRALFQGKQQKSAAPQLNVSARGSGANTPASPPSGSGSGTSSPWPDLASTAGGGGDAGAGQGGVHAGRVDVALEALSVDEEGHAQGARPAAGPGVGAGAGAGADVGAGGGGGAKKKKQQQKRGQVLASFGGVHRG